HAVAVGEEHRAAGARGDLAEEGAVEGARQQQQRQPPAGLRHVDGGGGGGEGRARSLDDPRGAPLLEGLGGQLVAAQRGYTAGEVAAGLAEDELPALELLAEGRPPRLVLEGVAQGGRVHGLRGER